MSVMNRVRLYHGTLATFAILAYLTGEIDPVHAWLGYGAAVVIVLRLLWAIGGERQAGLMRFYPNFESLKLGRALTHPAVSRTLMLGIALCLLTSAGTGIAMDQGRSIGLNAPAIDQAATRSTLSSADAARAENDRSRKSHDDDDDHDREDSLLSEIHELSANLLLLFVGLHVAYLLLFKRPLAKFMLFLPRPTKQKAAPPT